MNEWLDKDRKYGQNKKHKRRWLNMQTFRYKINKFWAIMYSMTMIIKTTASYICKLVRELI